jgi:hypothetical protein
MLFLFQYKMSHEARDPIICFSKCNQNGIIDQSHNWLTKNW